MVLEKGLLNKVFNKKFFVYSLNPEKYNQNE